jgi:hypothetical protein
METPKEDHKSNVYQFRNNGSTELDTNSANIGHSGNSDVDVQVSIEVDTRPIAYALLCSMLATKQLSQSEFETAVNKMEELTGKKESKKGINKEGSSNKQSSKKGNTKTQPVGRRKKRSWI